LRGGELEARCLLHWAQLWVEHAGRPIPGWKKPAPCPYCCRGSSTWNRNGGERILSRLSVEVLTTHQITPEQKAVAGFFPGFWTSVHQAIDD
jgi:hypothetical protein